jgi:pilus assembly protein CpaC
MAQKKNTILFQKSFLIFFACCLLVLLNSISTFADEEEEGILAKSKRYLILTIGIEQEEKMPPLPNNVEFKGTFKQITSAAYSKDLGTVRFNPIKEGNATFTIHDKNKNGKMIVEYILVVKKSKLDAVVREMQSLLGDIEGITIKIVNNKVLVDGQILLPRDMNRIHSVVKQFGDQAASLVVISPIAQKKIAEFISRDINNPEIEVRAVNDKFILQGVANSEDEKNRAEVIAKTYLPPVIQEAAVADGVMKTPKPANDGVINLITVKQSARSLVPKSNLVLSPMAGVN